MSTAANFRYVATSFMDMEMVFMLASIYRVGNKGSLDPLL